jgi:hypothetical protein
MLNTGEPFTYIQLQDENTSTTAEPKETTTPPTEPKTPEANQSSE